MYGVDKTSIHRREKERDSIKYIISYIVVALLVVSIVGPSIGYVLAETSTTTTPATTTSTPTSVPCQVVYAKAQVLYGLLVEALSLNISSTLKTEIEALLKTNISSLSCDELRKWVDRAVEIHSRAAGEIRSGLAYAVGLVEQRYLEGLKKVIEKRLEKLAREYNLSETEVESLKKNITEARDLAELSKALREVEEKVYVVKTRVFVEGIVNISIEDLVRDEKGLRKAREQIETVYEVIKGLIERLSEKNVSPAAIEALKRVLEKINETRRIVANVSIEISVSGTGNYSRDLAKALEKIREEVLEEIEELREELLELRQAFTEMGNTTMVQYIDQLLSKIENISSSIGNMSIEDLRKVLPDLIEIKMRVREIKRLYEEIYEEMSGREAVEAFQKILYRVNTTIEKIKNMTSSLEKALERVCGNTTNTSVYSGVCTLLKTAIERVKNMTREAESLVSDAMRLYRENKTLEALQRLVRAKAILGVCEGILEKIREAIEKISGAPGPGKAEISVKGYLRYVRNNTFLLHLEIENKGSVKIEIQKIVIVITPVVEVTHKVVVNPGQSVSIDLYLNLTPQQAMILRGMKTVTIIVVAVETQVTTVIEIEHD